eukprot:scaffold75843_cov61-Phaeocystis_antarctica.AAC.1
MRTTWAASMTTPHQSYYGLLRLTIANLEGEHEDAAGNLARARGLQQIGRGCEGPSIAGSCRVQVV